MSSKGKVMILVRRFLYFILPVVLLFYIFKRVDIDILISNLKNTNPWLVIAGILLRPMQIVIGSVRWRKLNHYFCKSNLPVKFMIQNYWSGLAIGYFTPGNIGWDAYRVLAVGRRIKTYTGAFITIIVEKFLGFFSVLTMALIMYPIISSKIVSNVIFFQKSYYMALIVIALSIVVIAFLVKKRNQKVLTSVKRFFDKNLKKLLNALNNRDIVEKIKRDYDKSNNILSFHKQPKTFLISFLLSIGILIVAAICSQLIFRGLDYKISFFVNLFVAPIFFIIFLIPISFGSIGVREGAFILLYGQFGVPMEVALLVSFFNLFGLFLNNIIGALFIFGKGLNPSNEEIKSLQ